MKIYQRIHDSIHDTYRFVRLLDNATVPSTEENRDYRKVLADIEELSESILTDVEE